MKNELTKEQEIEQAIKEMGDAMLNNVKASKMVVDAEKLKQKTHYDVTKASERLRSLQIELMQNV